MNYRTFGQIPFTPSALGFGAMRLPVLNNDMRQIDETKAIEMIRYAIDHGLNYVDTAYPYHGGTSEVVVGKALRDGYREKVFLADKMPVWLVETPEDFDKYFEEQRQRLGVQRIDCYLLHALNGERWAKTANLGALAWAEKRKAAGDIGWFGFSFHGSYEEFTAIVDANPKWDFCMLQYNYADEDVQAGRRGLEYAHARGMGVIAMEPLRGGDLAHDIPEFALKPYRELHPDRSLPEWGLRWLWNQPELSFTISGMSTLDQVKENIHLAETVTPPFLTPAELDAVHEVKATLENLRPIRCTGCGYCRECPQGILIPQLFSIYNDYMIYKNATKARMMFSFIEGNQFPQNCINCRKCVDSVHREPTSRIGWGSLPE